MKRRPVLPPLALAILTAACGPAKPPNGASPAEVAAERGRRVYATNCTVCHNPDPSRPGAIGPPVKGSSRALIEARVLRAGYPPGYKPKRASKAMPAQPHLAGSIDDLAAYLK
jgi:mono/diheme cytochrome c family protein